MANEIQAEDDTGLTLYCVVLDSAIRAWTGSAWEAYDPTHRTAYALAVPETALSGLYSADFPAAITAGVYTALIFERAGGSPSASDVALSPLTVYWTGPVAPSAVTPTLPAVSGSALCTDEDVAVRCPEDFLALCPVWQRSAYGTDGVISGWDLSSLTADPLSYGVAAGAVVCLSAPLASFKRPELYAVSGVAANRFGLRRLGLAAGVGQPPPQVPAVTFEARTLAPQIEQASYDARKFFGVDDLVPEKTTANLYDPRELRQYVVLTVLQRRYAGAEKDKASDYALKLEQVSRELAELQGSLTVRWGSAGDSRPETSVFSMGYRR